MRKNIFLFLGFLLLLGAYFPATAASEVNLVTNPGFETGDFFEWNISNNGIQPSIWPLSIRPQYVHTGQYGAHISGEGSISQNVSLPGPGKYQFGGYLRFFSTGVNMFTTNSDIASITFVGSYILSAPSTISMWYSAGDSPGPGGEMSDWMYFSGIYDYAGPGGNVILRIGLNNGSPGYTSLAVDDIFVTLVNKGPKK